MGADPVTIGLIASAGAGLIASNSANRTARGVNRQNQEITREQLAFQREQAAILEEQKEVYRNFEFVNPYANLENRFAGIENQFADITNPFANMRVATQAAEFQAEQGTQQRANILSQLRAAAGTSGIGGLAQSLANQGVLQSRQIAANIQQHRSGAISFAC